MSLPLPPNMDASAALFGVAMVAGDVGAHATPQDSHLTHHGGGVWGPAPESGWRVEWLCGSVIGWTLVKYIPLTPEALILNINRQTSRTLLQANCWHVKIPRNASQDPEPPPDMSSVALPGLLGQSWLMYSVRLPTVSSAADRDYNPRSYHNIHWILILRYQ